MKSLLLSIVVCCFWAHAFSQDTVSNIVYNKWHIKASAGVNIPLTNFLNGNITDNLIMLNDKPTFHVQYFGFAYFFTKHWGVEADLHVNYQTQKMKENKQNDLKQRIFDEFEDNYFIENKWFLSPKTTSDFSCSLGIVYRIESGSFYFYPKLSVGFKSINVETERLMLKQKNSHNLLELQYAIDNKDIDDFIVYPFSLSTSIGYKLNKKLRLNIDVATSAYYANITFNKSLKNFVTESVDIKQYHYKKTICNLYLGAGLMIVF